MNFFRQWYLLTTRSFHVFWAEKSNCLWTIGQVPLMAFLVVVCFYGFNQEDPALDFFSRFNHHAQKYMDEQEKQGETIIIGKETAARLYYESQIQSNMISVGTAQRRAGVHYLLISAAIWFGLMGACKEIAGERHILARESRSSYGLGPYLLSKFTFQIFIVGVQTLALGALTIHHLLELKYSDAFLLSLLLWAIAVAAVCMGLLLSVGSSSVRTAMTWVPILMIPQFLFGGLLRPLSLAVNETPPPDLAQSPKQIDSFHGLRSLLACCVIQRWGFDAALSMDSPYRDGNVILLRYAWPEVEKDSPSWRSQTFLRIVRTTEKSLANTILTGSTPIDPLLGIPNISADEGLSSHARIRRALLALGSMSIIMLISVYCILRLQFH